MDIRIEEKDGLTLIRLNGVLTHVSADDFCRVCHDLVDKGKVKIILDMSGVGQLDSTGLGVLVEVFRRTTSRGGNVFLLNVPKELEEFFRITRLNRTFSFFKSLDDALKAFEG
ncbi:MAG: STAS domain-containing protein [bacterium]